MNQPESVTLSTIAAGALNELFEAELKRVLSNITDPNTDDKQKRSITMKVTFKPNRDRDAADVEVTCGSKLAGIMTVETKVYMGKHRGELIAVENDPRQSTLFDTDRRREAIASFPIAAAAPKPPEEGD